MFSHQFQRSNTICDFLFTSLYEVGLQNVVFCQKKETAQRKRLSSYEKGGKMKMAVFLHLKMYPFTVILITQILMFKCSLT